MVVPVQNGIYTREDIWSLQRWDPTLLWYAKAVGALWPVPIANPASWRYQAAIHGYGPMDAQDPSLDPLSQPGEALAADKATYWHQCQHSTWYFLPWHRGYLGYFERLIRKTIVDLGGPADWALPFWNYSDTTNPNAQQMRPEFLEATLPEPGNPPNPLNASIMRGPHRLTASPYGQAGDFQISNREYSLACLTQPLFNDPAASAPDFGGNKTGFLHDVGPDAAPGALEVTPHGDIHMAVGGRQGQGWMASFDTAALDPIFWIHHSNIDRLWTVWLAQSNPARDNPADPDWLNPAGPSMPFNLHDENAAPVTFVPADVLDTRARLFSYQYQGHAQLAAAAPAVAAAMVATMTLNEPRLVAASATNIDAAAVRTISVQFDPKGPSLSMLGAATASHAYLNFENISGSGALVAHYVYLDLPAGADPEASDPYYAGSLPLFGVHEASRKGAIHSTGGLNYILDVTNVVQYLQQHGSWDEKSISVQLVPRGVMDASATLNIGRVSLYYR